MKVLDVILEKGKGAIIEKLRIIELIEADIQLLTRITVNKRNKHNIEKYPRIAKYNYSLRPNYSIKDAILEKRLAYDNSIINENYTICNMTDLESCYNR